MLCEKCRASIERRELPFPKGTKLRVPDATFGVMVEGAEFHARTRYGEFVELGYRYANDPGKVHVHPYNKKGEPEGVLLMDFEVLECCEAVPKPFEAASIRVIAT